MRVTFRTTVQFSFSMESRVQQLVQDLTLVDLTPFWLKASRQAFSVIYVSFGPGETADQSRPEPKVKAMPASVSFWSRTDDDQQHAPESTQSAAASCCSATTSSRWATTRFFSRTSSARNSELSQPHEQDTGLGSSVVNRSRLLAAVEGLSLGEYGACQLEAQPSQYPRCLQFSCGCRVWILSLVNLPS